MKKIILSTFIGLSMLSMRGTTVNASTSNELSISINETMIEYRSQSPDLSTEKTPLLENKVLFEEFKNPTNTSKLVVTSTGLLGTGLKGTSESTTLEDYISVTVTAYSTAGDLKDSDKDEAKKATYVQANTLQFPKSGFAYGNHTYKLAGYKDVYHETKQTY